MVEKQLTNKLRKLKAITKVLQYACSDFELEFLARVSVRELINIVGCDGCAVILAEGSRVRILAERNFSERYGKVRLTTGTPMIEYILDTGRTIFTTDSGRSPIQSCLPQKSNINSLIFTPSISDDGAVIIVYMDSMEKNAFNEEDLKLAKMVATDISLSFNRTRAAEHLDSKNASTKDTATGCFNRRKFDTDTVTEIDAAQEFGRQLSLLMINANWFKTCDNTKERRKSRVHLRKLASVLKYNTRPYDKVYRYSRETFAILMGDTDKNGALLVADRLQKLFNQEIIKESITGGQASGIKDLDMGVASFPSDANCSYELIQAAQSELYRLKIQSAIHEIVTRP